MGKTSRMFKRQNRRQAILTPLDVEKWANFSSKMFCPRTYPSACKRDHRVTRAILSEIPGINVNGTIALFKKYRGYCDCEVVMNAMRHLEREYNSICDTCYLEKMVGEEFDPDSPKWKELLGQCNWVYSKCHEKLEAEEEKAKQASD